MRPMTGAEVPAAAAMLVRAFDDDPMANFIFAGDLRRRRGLHSVFATQLRRHYLPHGHVYVAGDDVAAAAVWGPPGRQRNGLRELVELLPSAPFLVSTRMRRVLRLLFAVDRLHPTGPHWYLATLGTEPDRQGQGLGSALLTPVLSRADHDGQPAYLESSKERNVAFYSRFGFEVVDEFRADSGGPPIWRMWRTPRVPED
jgi:ribosomal protein S18 acetylase RimI-like enzyme